MNSLQRLILRKIHYHWSLCLRLQVWLTWTSLVSSFSSTCWVSCWRPTTTWSVIKTWAAKCRDGGRINSIPLSEHFVFVFIHILSFCHHRLSDSTQIDPQISEDVSGLERSARRQLLNPDKDKYVMYMWSSGFLSPIPLQKLPLTKIIYLSTRLKYIFEVLFTYTLLHFIWTYCTFKLDYINPVVEEVLTFFS